MSENRFPVDIFAIKEYGVDKWHEEFFWPVSDDEFISLYNDITQCLVDEINNQQRQAKIPLIIQHQFLNMEYANFLHALKVINKFRPLNMDLFYSNDTWWYKNLVLGKSIDTHLANIVPAKDRYPVLSETINPLIKTIFYNLNILPSINAIKTGEAVKLLGSISPLLKQYLKMYVKQPVFYSSQQEWLSKGDLSYKLPENLRNALRSCSQSISNRLALISEKIGIPLPDGYRRHLERLTEKELSNTSNMLHLVKQRIKNHSKIHLLMPSRGNPFYLTIGMAVQEFGGRVTNFAHGGETGFLNLPILLASRFDTPTVNTFVTYTEESAALYERIKGNHSLCKNNPMKIISGESNEYSKICARLKKKRLPEQIKRVMIIGYPHSQRRRPLVGAFSLLRLDLELRLLEALRRAGYKVLYKAHPDRISEIEGIFANRCQVVKGHLQEHLDEADAFLFPSVTTTAFSMALCTNKPIITLDLSYKGQQPFSEAMELLRRRCKIVTTKFDQRNRVTFNEDELLDAVSSRPEEPDNGFIEKYMFPGNVKEHNLYKKGNRL